MSDPHVGEVRLFAGTFAPVGWMLCDGRLLNIDQHTDLFTLIGTTFGGDGIRTFAVPDLRGRVPIHQGSRPGGAPRTLGESGGEESATLTAAQLPDHTHGVAVSSSTATSRTAVGNVRGALPGSMKGYAVPGATDVAGHTSIVGGSQPHENRQPFLAINYIIALTGEFPAQD